jgi:DNA-binding response OmpR family regulator
VDDDIELVEMLRDYLLRDGFNTTAVYDGDMGIEYALSGQYDLLILDVMLPGTHGIEVLRRVRMHSHMPILMLTAKGDDMDRIIGLELGADDYVPKPCTPRELSARIRAILRRIENKEQKTDDFINVGPLTLYPAERRVLWNSRLVELTSTEFNLLEVLARYAGQVVTKAMLSEEGLGRPLARFDRSIDVHVSSIRHKLTQFDERPCIQTIYRRGYQLIRM